MRFLLAGILLAEVLYSQGTPVPLKTWVRPQTRGWGVGVLGFEKLSYSPSLDASCFIGSYHEQDNEANQGVNCYSFTENRWFVLHSWGKMLDSYGWTAGHPQGLFAWMGAPYNSFWTIGGNSGSNMPQFTEHTFWLDTAGGVTRDKYTGVLPNLLPWIGANVFGTSAWDSANSKLVLYPNLYLDGTLTIYDPATNLYTRTTGTGTAHPGNSYPHSAFNSLNNRVYFYGSGGTCGSPGSATMTTYDVATNAWAAVTQNPDPVNGSPGARAWAGFAFSPVDNILLLANGCDATHAVINDTWAFHLDTNTWEKLSVSPTFSYPAVDEMMTYDSVNNSFVMVLKGGGNDFTGGSNANIPFAAGAWVFCYSACQNYGRVSNTYAPAVGYINRRFTGVGVGGTTNRADGQYEESYAAWTSLAADSSGKLYAAWIENGASFSGGDLGFRHPYTQFSTDGISWTNMNPSYTTFDGTNIESDNTHIAVVNGTPWLAWDSSTWAPINNSIKTSFWNGTAWSAPVAIPIVGGAGHYAGISALTGVGTVPTIAVIENDHSISNTAELYVNQWGGSSWSQLGTGLHVNSGGRPLFVDITSDGSAPYVCFVEEVSASSNITLTPQVYCKYRSGGAWVQIASSLNQSATSWASSVSVTYFGAKLYVAWTERTTSGLTKLFVNQCTTSACTLIGNDLRRNTTTGWAWQPKLANDGTNLYLSHEEQSNVGQTSQLYVQKWNGTSWTTLSGSVNMSASGSAAFSSLIVSLGQPIVLWTEQSKGNLRQVYIKWWNGAQWAPIQPIQGLGASTFTCVDKDGDGYGTGAGCAGPDSDDENASVHTSAEAIAAYGSIPALFNRRGYTPSRYWVLDVVNGNNGTGVSCTPATFSSCMPFVSWSAIVSLVTAGDAIVWRAGTYNGGQVNMKSGATNNPVYYLGYPGETVLISSINGVWDILSKSWIVVDGVKFSGASSCMSGGSNDNINPPPTSSTFHDNIFRHIEGSGCSVGIQAFNALQNILIEESSFHDSPLSHGVYLGSRGPLISTNVTVQRVLTYRNFNTGLQFNGRCSGCTFQQIISYHNYNSGFSWEQGLTNSLVDSNIAMDNGEPGLGKQTNISVYDGTEGQVNCGWDRTQVCTCNPPNDAAICPFTQSGNMFSNNLWYNSGFNRDGGSIADMPLVQIGRASNCTTATCRATTMGPNTFRNSLIVTAGASSDYEPPFVWTNGSTAPDSAITTTVTGMMYYQRNGRLGLMGYGLGGGGYGYDAKDCTQSASILASISNCSRQDPLFTALGAWNNMAGFNFHLTAPSPAVHTGVAMTSPTRDLVGIPYAPVPSMGPLEGGPPTIVTDTLPPATVTQVYSQNLSISGGTAPISCVNNGGLVGSGLSVTTGCTVTGTASTAGTYVVSVTPTDVNGISGSAHNVNVTINSVPVITNSSPLPGGTQGVSYSQQLVASPAGTVPDTWDISTGVLCSGLALSSSGLITGTPTASQTCSFTARVTDANGIFATKAFILTISPPSIPCSITLNPTSPGPYTAGQSGISIIATANNCGAGTLTWTSSSLPTGLSGCNGVVGSSCTISGSSTVQGTFSSSVSVSDGGTNSASTNPSISVNAAPAVSTASLPNGIRNQSYSQQLSASPVGTAPDAWDLASGSLCNGLSLSSGGVLSGVPTILQTCSFTVRVTDSNNVSASRFFSLTVKRNRRQGMVVIQ